MIEQHLQAARELITETALWAGGRPHRINEVEVYHNSEEHPDPFCHRNELQSTWHRWCFHRQGTNYRGGSFKGLDLTFGQPGSFCGVLIRTLELWDGSPIEGPSLVVDFLLRMTRFPHVRDLDAAIGKRTGWDDTSPIHLKKIKPREQPIFTSARVGLSSKHTDEYRHRPYRLFVLPNRMRKGRPLIVQQMILEGRTDDEIHRLTGMRLNDVRRHRESALS
ncbi:DNA-3-methyladenine glycosylase [Zavarzinella formosa]|uniref:DNA-3-methyladenine glycosylase n=1 Tax=Zavarzinella formosa TaxID=360055 RepID=UPI0012FC2346|nr:DNA-3-methyladenine glycosylase [Zavarzinella formosa]